MRCLTRLTTLCQSAAAPGSACRTSRHRHLGVPFQSSPCRPYHTPPDHSPQSPTCRTNPVQTRLHATMPGQASFTRRYRVGSHASGHDLTSPALPHYAPPHYTPPDAAQPAPPDLTMTCLTKPFHRLCYLASFTIANFTGPRRPLPFPACPTSRRRTQRCDASSRRCATIPCQPNPAEPC